MPRKFLITLFLTFLFVCSAEAQSKISDGFTNASGETISHDGTVPFSDPGLSLPLPQENFDAILSAVSEYVQTGDLTEEQYDEFCSSLTECTPKNPFHKPTSQTGNAVPGTAVSFETTDLDGKPVTSADLFGGHKVTMLNIWDSSCAACITEMPDLIRLNDEFSEQGGQVIGLAYAADSEELITEAKEITEDLRLDFVTLLPNEAIRKIFPVQTFPTTYFIDQKGMIIGDPILGAAPHRYRIMIGQILASD